ncbi:ATP-dependent bile acid permease [Lasiosphaeria miniovina]|uniref:ATP-dependent bile acid permease n=1 Tax=Lasiosphaeria miniovina TaxID=1954250 RepID=A0AA40BF13_9PEZI|nr:ATP-dependent bile acid permease [Lasiosphaeria miniovina]KAK0733048.1 ATP-dependent bile acid permease [Lasiosphaeria miniovina]
MQQDLSFYAAAAALAVSALATIPAIVAHTRRIRKNARPAGEGNGYRDRDGEATPQSIAAFSNKWQKALILLWAGVGLGCQTAFSLVLNASPLHSRWLLLQSWLTTTSWGLLLVQAIAIAANRDSVRVYYQGMSLSGSSLLVGGALLVQLNGVAPAWWSAAEKPALVLCTASAIAAAGLVVASLSLPRRPDVFYNSRLVDRMLTVSAYRRLTFAWASALMSVATEKGDLELTDLPGLNHQMRPTDQSAQWKAVKAKTSVIKSLLKIYAWRIFKQWTTAMANTAVSYLPWWITLRLLESLEARKPGDPIGPRLWLLLVWLGMAKLASALLESWLFWTMVSDLYVPIRSQLAAVIFEKAMRRKNVKSTSKSQEKKGDTNAAEQNDTAQPSQPSQGEGGGDTSKEGDDNESDNTTGQKSRQAVINLVGVDAKRVSNFSLYQYMFPTSILQLVISMWFLVYLLGWIPIALGILSVVLTIPINTVFSKVLFNTDNRLMKLRDAKLALVNEALQGIRQVKFSALELQWEKRILDLRQKELTTLWEYFRANVVLNGCWTAAPIVLSLTSLGSYAWLHGDLAASVAFVSIGILNTLDFAISAMPQLIRFGIDCWVSVKRIEAYLDGPELKPTRNYSDRPDICLEHASLAWPKQQQQQQQQQDRFTLRDVNLTFPPGELSVISGKTGSGKSLLLAAVLGEADLLSGSIHVPAPPGLDERHDDKAHPGNWVLPAAIAYVGQVPWIENGTLRDNVLFGMPFDEARYAQTLAACALNKDLEALPDGDRTELGVNGVNLSGGQKWRVTVARAVYSRAGILVLDDIFSAVDAHVSRHILDHCIDGPLCKGRTRILVTHHVALVEKHAKLIIELADGCATYYSGDDNAQLQDRKFLERIKSIEQQQPVPEESADVADDAPLKRQNSKVAKKFVEDEAHAKGSVKPRIYGVYIKDSGGWIYWGSLLLMFLLFQACSIAQPWVIRLWTGELETSSIFIEARPRLPFYSIQQTLVPNGHHGRLEAELSSGHAGGRGTLFWLSIYAAVCFAGVALGLIRFLVLFLATYRASKALYEKILFAVLRAPLRWTDTVPVGRILNRFTADFDAIDGNVAHMGGWFMVTLLNAVGICVASLFVSPLMAPVAALCLGYCAWVGKVYLVAARPAKRLESTAKSPIFDFFGSSLTGLTTIRAFDRALPCTRTMYAKIEEYSMCSMNLYLFNRWVGWNMSVAGIVFTVVVTVFVLVQAGVDAALAGFVLSFTMQFSDTVLMVVRAYAAVELEMNAVERVVEYSEIETEDFGGAKAPAAWPTQGRLEVNDLVVGYAPHLPPVLKGITFQVDPAERIGVVGRTGAGKSSLTLALFRFLEPRSGSIYVDGLDVAKVSLLDLRSRLAIIPQDPVLFSGTIRSNLDPFDDHSDAELHDSLQRVHLVSDSESGAESSTTNAEGTATTAVTRPRNINIFRDLSSPISEGGHNLSQGQRQLLCLARAIVSRPKIMVLDEATSAVDMGTDALIQRSIRDEFVGSTLIVIAHRLSTIADFDRILVLGDGEVMQYGTPKELWDTEGSIFRSMCEESGEKEKLKKVILGEEALRDE